MPEAASAAERLAWVRAFDQTRDAAAICRRFAITRATLRKWWQRYERDGTAGLEDASRTPATSPNRKVFGPQAEIIRNLRASGTPLAAIRTALLERHGIDVSIPTIRRILRPAQPAAAPPPAAQRPGLFAAALPDDPIARTLAADIARGRVRPGERLVEEALGRTFRAGRRRVRAALRALAALGLVRIERNRGALVAAPSAQAVAEAYAARRLVEAGICQQVAAHRTPAQIDTLRAHLRRQSDAERRGDKVTLVHLLTDFHLLLASIAGNPPLHAFLETLVSTTSLAVLLYDQSDTPSCAVQEHRDLVRLLETGDGPAAAALMARHLGHNHSRQDPSLDQE